MEHETSKQRSSDKPARKTYVELGEIMLREHGAAACQEAYDTVDPEWVGRTALSFCDINRDGTLN
jgi:hypothetical protein